MPLTHLEPGSDFVGCDAPGVPYVQSGTSSLYGIAVDLGTTSVSLALVRFAGDGAPQVLASAEARNAQAAEYGRDILSRLSAAQAGQGLQLRDLAQAQVLELVAEVARQAKLELSELGAKTKQVVIAGNSAMAALFVGADVNSLATAPFVPVRPLPCDSGPLAELIGPERITVLEPLDAFIGGDVRADLITASLTAGSDKPRLLIDFGTNVEIVIAQGLRLFMCSAPAGPAFEGGGFRLRGSEILADVADLLRQDVLGTDGKLTDGDSRVKRDQNGVANVFGARSGQAISQRFIRDLQLAKAATSTALRRLLTAADLQPEDVVRVDIAGAFGSALTTADLAILGLIPKTWQDRTHALGNASLAGALAVLGGASPELDPGVALCPVALPIDPVFNTELIAATDFSWR
ncbi:MAG: ASKHA domain-containing protein [Coriobacteriia bacterium]|nr:ASKHA domain-containing protein [Coriobacteriia bacterium]